MENSLDPDQLAVQNLHCFQNADLFWLSRIRVYTFMMAKFVKCVYSVYFCIGSNKEELLNKIIFICLFVHQNICSRYSKELSH